MKLTKKQLVVYEKEVKSFVDFYELKCNLPGHITGEDIEVREELYPQGVLGINATLDDYSIGLSISFDTELGVYPVSVDICFLSGNIKVKFETDVYKNEDNNGITCFKAEQITKKDLNNLVSKFLPVVESFLDTLDGLNRNHPCEKKCYYNKLRKEEGGCDKMYISKKEYTPKKNAKRQRLLLGREEMSKHKYDI